MRHLIDALVWKRPTSVRRKDVPITAKDASAADGRRFLLIGCATCLAVFVATYNTTAIMTALPAVRSSLDIGTQTLQWVINIYMLAVAVTMASMGRFADILGKLRVLLIGIGAFAVSSLIIIFSADSAMLLAGRTLQGVGVAGIVSSSAAIMQVAAPEEKRAEALGLWAASAAFGFAMGPVIGGAMTDLVSWRGIFVLDLPLLALAALLCWRIEKLGIAKLHGTTETTIDYPGICLLIVTLGTFVYGLTSGQQAGWAALQTIALFSIAGLCAVLFVVRERRAKNPLVDFGFFRQSRYLAATLGMFLVGILMMGVFYDTALFIQTPGALHFTAFQAGLALLPFTLLMFLTSLIAPRVLGEGSFRLPVTIGMLVLAVGYWLMHDISNQSSYADVFWKLMILGFGLGLCYALLPRVGLRGLPDKSAGQGSGVINTFYFVGVAIGIAAGGIVSQIIKRTLVGPTVEKLLPGDADHEALEVTLVHGSQTEVDQALARLSPDTADKLRAAMQAASDNAFDGVMGMMAVVALLGAAVSTLLIRGPRS